MGWLVGTIAEGPLDLFTRDPGVEVAIIRDDLLDVISNADQLLLFERILLLAGFNPAVPVGVELTRFLHHALKEDILLDRNAQSRREVCFQRDARRLRFC